MDKMYSHGKFPKKSIIQQKELLQIKAAYEPSL